jgi:iron complex outermembrane receptor protein
MPPRSDVNGVRRPLLAAAAAGAWLAAAAGAPARAQPVPPGPPVTALPTTPPSATAPNAAPSPPQGTPPGPPVVALPEVDVTASPELLSAPLPRDEVPAEVNTVTSGEVVRTGIPDMTGALNQNVPGVSLENAGGNPAQPQLTYHGFTASPLQGSEQGLAVYVNGMRFNQPFGDTVNWDLIPALAIDQMTMEGANPVFGLNALGGSLAVQLKNGFSFHGADASVYGGSFGQVGSNFEWGTEKNGTATYVTGNVMDENGWRNEQKTRLRQLYGDIGWRGDAAEAHISVTAAQNTLDQPGTLPVGMLQANPASIFTGPNESYNQYLSLTGNLTYDVTDTTSVQALAYYDNFSNRIINGNAPNFQQCSLNPGFLCEQDGVTPLTGRNGAQIPAFNGAGPYSQLALQGIDTNGYGGSVQATNTDKVFGFANNLVVGASFDGGVSTFDGNNLAGGFNPGNAGFIGPGVEIDQADLSLAPVRVTTTNAYYGIYANDILELTKRLSLTLSGRFNFEQIDLQGGQTSPALTGNHDYNHFNPGAGLTYKLGAGVSAYASYAVSNRAPTPLELSCASITSPCSIANFFVGDPNLKQVVARTAEVGLRGENTPFAGGKLNWDIDAYRTETQDDIIFAPAAIPGLDYFQNVGRTQRQGVDITANLIVGTVSFLLGYSFTDATFATPLTLDSPLNPAANALGQENVPAGALLPGIPMHTGKLGFDWQATPKWVLGSRLIVYSGQVLFGDEANLTPNTGAYAVLDLNTSYQITKNIQLFGMVENAFNMKYYVYGTFTDTTSVPNVQAPNTTNTRSFNPGAPIAGFGGLRMTF